MRYRARARAVPFFPAVPAPSRPLVLFFLALASFAAPLFVPGCGLVPERARNAAVEGVRWYCDREPLSRSAVRAETNAELAADGMAVRVWCPGDPGNPAEENGAP